MVGSGEGSGSGRMERAEYIERMSQELSRMAASANLPVLAYLLDMATQEAAATRASTQISFGPDDIPGRSPRRFSR